MPKRNYEGVYQRPDSCWLWIRWTDAQGRPARAPTRYRKDQGAEAWQGAAALRASHQAKAHQEKMWGPPPQPPERPVYRFNDLMLKYLNYHTRKRSAEQDRYCAKRLYPTFNGRDLATVDGLVAADYIAARLSTGVSPATLNREIGLFSAALNWARRELKWDLPNPWQGRRLPETPRERWLEKQEALTLIRAIQTEERPQFREDYQRLLDFVLLDLNTAMRPGEILGLEITRINLHTRLIRLRKEDQKNKKSGSVPINDVARQAILSRLRFRSAHCPDSPWLFCHPDGRQVQSLRRSFQSACRRAGLVNVQLRDLRRTLASWMVQDGEEIQVVAELLRHADIRVTWEHYAHLAPRNTREAVERAAFGAKATITLAACRDKAQED